MKLIHLKNLKRECVLVELPEDDVAREPYGFDQTHIYHGHAPIVYHLKRGDQDDSTRAINLDMGYGWKLLGKFTDLKEEDFEGVVHTDEVYDPIRFPWGEGIVYKNYNSHTWGWSAKESFISAIEAEGWYTENPITNPYEQFHWCEEWKQNAIKYYNEAQEKVINLSNCYLFIKS